mgnify:FL=1
MKSMLFSHRKVARALIGAGSACALIVAGAFVPLRDAVADDAITGQDYVSYYHLDQVKAKGITGKGVKIALIGGLVDTSAPELAGATIIDQSPCKFDPVAQTLTRPTAMASVLVSQSYGVAPGATLMTYGLAGSHYDTSGECIDSDGNAKFPLQNLIHQAIDDGAQLIVMSLPYVDEEAEDDLSIYDLEMKRIMFRKRQQVYKWAIAHAMANEVPIVASVGDEPQDATDYSYSALSGVVGVSGIAPDGQLTARSSWGQVVTASLGANVNVRVYPDKNVEKMDCSSCAAAITTGFLALAREKWPQATGNQLLQLLVRTGTNPGNSWNERTGFGPTNLEAMLSTDPSRFPDENPLPDKTKLGKDTEGSTGFGSGQGGSVPLPQEVADYGDGLASPLYMRDEEPNYTYRGLDDLYAMPDGSVSALPIHLGTSPRLHKKKK